MSEELFFEKVKKIHFEKKPIPLSPNYRPIYKITQLALVLKMCSRGGSASLLKLHFFSCVMKSEVQMEKLIRFISEGTLLDFPIWRFEPTVNRALGYAVAEGFFAQDKATYKLTLKGEEFVKQILDVPEIMAKEKNFLKNLGKKITEKFIQELSKRWEN